MYGIYEEILTLSIIASIDSGWAYMYVNTTRMILQKMFSINVSITASRIFVIARKI